MTCCVTQLKVAIQTSIKTTLMGDGKWEQWLVVIPLVITGNKPDVLQEKVCHFNYLYDKYYDIL